MAMLAGWTRCGLALLALLTGLTGIARLPSLACLSSLPGVTCLSSLACFPRRTCVAGLARLAGLTRIARLSCLPCLSCLPGLSCLALRSSRPWLRGRVHAPVKEQRNSDYSYTEEDLHPILLCYIRLECRSQEPIVLGAVNMWHVEGHRIERENWLVAF
jgi:hypothetical protein